MLVEVIQSIGNSKISRDDIFLKQIEHLDDVLTKYFSDTFIIDGALTRKLVSFQAIKFVHITDGTNIKRLFLQT